MAKTQILALVLCLFIQKKSQSACGSFQIKKNLPLGAFQFLIVEAVGALLRFICAHKHCLDISYCLTIVTLPTSFMNYRLSLIHSAVYHKDVRVTVHQRAE